MSRRFLALVILGLALACATRPLVAQGGGAPPSAADLTKPLPFDPLITVGTLDNGLRYYIRVNKYPEKRASLRLTVNAGSVLEADDQRGLANVHYLQSIGVRFRADVNGYTSFDETVYMLEVPTDSGTFLQKSIEILADWAHGQVFDSAEVDAERGVVIEEWRLRRGAGAPHAGATSARTRSSG